MKIVIAAGPMLPVPALRGGAIPRLWESLGQEFARNGHVVTVLARAFPGQPARETREGVEYRRWGGFDQSPRIAWDLARDLLYGIRLLPRLPRADILVTNTFWLPALAAAVRPAAGRVVVNANRFPKGQFRLYRRVALVAAASVAVRDEILRQMPGLAGRVEVLPNPIDLRRLQPAPDRSVPDEPRRLLYVGRVHPEKGLHLLVPAFQRLGGAARNWRLRVVGPWEEAQGGGGAGYLASLQASGQGAAVDWVGPIFDPEALAREYARADLFVYPSLAEKGESFGVAPLEAMACGVPAVVSNLACFRDYLEEGANGWVFDHRAADPVEALRAALAGAMGHEAGRQSAGLLARQKAQAFGVEAVGRQYLEAFARLLAGSTGGRGGSALDSSGKR